MHVSMKVMMLFILLMRKESMESSIALNLSDSIALNSFVVVVLLRSTFLVLLRSTII